MAWYSLTATSMGTSWDKSFNLGVGEDFAVDDVFDFLQFLLGHLGEVEKSKRRRSG